MEKVQRLEGVIFGVPEEERRGLSERMNTTEATANELRKDARRLTWLMVAMIVTGLVNMLLASQRSAAPTYLPASAPSAPHQP